MGRGRRDFSATRILQQEQMSRHPVIDPEGGSESGAAVSMKLWQQTRKHLAGFPSRTRVIGERQYLSFNDYLKWRGRRAKGT